MSIDRFINNPPVSRQREKVERGDDISFERISSIRGRCSKFLRPAVIAFLTTIGSAEATAQDSGHYETGSAVAQDLEFDAALQRMRQSSPVFEVPSDAITVVTIHQDSGDGNGPSMNIEGNIPLQGQHMVLEVKNYLQSLTVGHRTSGNSASIFNQVMYIRPMSLPENRAEMKSGFDGSITKVGVGKTLVEAQINALEHAARCAGGISNGRSIVEHTDSENVSSIFSENISSGTECQIPAYQFEQPVQGEDGSYHVRVSVSFGEVQPLTHD